MTTVADPPTRTRLPRAVYVLALTVFCLGTSEFMIAGLLPDISDDLHVSVPAVGVMISAFAVGMLVGAPVMALLTLRLPRRLTLVGAALVFAAVHLVVLVTDDYAAIVAARVVAAVACATFWAVASVTAVALADERTRARTLSILLAGLTVANVIGVPAGTWIGDRFGWRAAFVAVAVATLVATVATVFAVPETRARVETRLRTLAAGEVRAMRNPRLLLALATTATYQAAVFGTFSYLAPLLIRVGGVPAGLIPAVLLGFGVGSFVGITGGARFADRNLFANMYVSLAALFVSLVVLWAVSSVAIAAVVAVVLFGVSGFSIASAINARVFLHVGDAPNLGAAFNVTAFNVGNAVGPWLGGLVIAGGLGLRAPIGVSLALVVVAAALTTASRWVERERVTRRCETQACAA